MSSRHLERMDVEKYVGIKSLYSLKEISISLYCLYVHKKSAHEVIYIPKIGTDSLILASSVLLMLPCLDSLW